MITCTTFPGRDDPGGTRFDLTRADLLAALRTPTPDGLLYPRDVAKADLPFFTLAAFRDDERALDNVERVYALGFDVDEAPVPDAATLRALPIAGAFFPSSRSTPSAPRWRLFLWLDRPVNADEYYRLWSYVAGRLPFPVGQAAKDPSRGWYVPREPTEGAYELHDIAGAPLPVDALLSQAPDVARPRVREGADGGIGVVPVDINTPLGRERVARAERFLREEAIVAISGQHGQDRAFGVAQRLMRGYEIPIEEALALWEEHYNPRCDPPWAEHEIERKLRHARDVVAGPTGTPSEGYLETLGHPQAGTLRAPGRSFTQINQDRRRVRRADHHYTYMGHEPTKPEARAAEANDLIKILTSHDAWRGVLQYDEFRRELRAVEPPMRLDAESVGLTKTDVVLIAGWFRTHGLLARKEVVYDAIITAASMCRFHPVREYLQELPDVPVNEARATLEGLSEIVLGNGEEHARIWFSRWLVAAVRRVLQPGTKVDTMLVLYGGQGAQKSTLCEILAGADYFKDELDEMTGRDAAHALEGVWILEIAELKGLIKSGHTAAKAYLSRRVDRYRQFGNGDKIRTPRECVMVGTTNDREILTDPTGSRRFWPIGLPDSDTWTIPNEWVRANRDQIWAAALALALDASFPHWTTREEDRRMAGAKEQFTDKDPWREILEDHCAGRRHVATSGKLYTDVIAAADDTAQAKLTKQIASRIGDIMIALGCTYGTVRDGARVFKGWLVPDALATAAPSEKEARARAVRNLGAKAAAAGAN